MEIVIAVAIEHCVSVLDAAVGEGLDWLEGHDATAMYEWSRVRCAALPLPYRAFDAFQFSKKVVEDAAVCDEGIPQVRVDCIV